MVKRSRDELASVEEERIIELLQKDARMPLAKIAKLVGLSENTVRKRIEKLIKRGSSGFIQVLPSGMPETFFLVIMCVLR